MKILAIPLGAMGTMLFLSSNTMSEGIDQTIIRGVSIIMLLGACLILFKLPKWPKWRHEGDDDYVVQQWTTTILAFFFILMIKGPQVEDSQYLIAGLGVGTIHIINYAIIFFDL